MPGNDVNTKRRRLWQFSLRTLLVLMLLVATFLGGWKASDWYRERELKRAAAAEEQKILELIGAGWQASTENELRQVLELVDQKALPFPDEGPLSLPAKEDREQISKPK